ncbi:MAG TPA: hypothetical protein VNM72_16020 [Blastocatellia bacterium]|nr:hypothetical protein [Blastocatellia bacterium]
MADLTRQSSTSDNERGYETRDLNVSAVGKFLIGLFALICLTLVAMNELFQYFEQRAIRRDVPLPPMLETREIPPEPRLQVAPTADLQKLRATEEELLTTYGWVDRERGIVRIPIERAMDLMLERGLSLPSRSPSPQSPAPTPDQRESPTK